MEMSIIIRNVEDNNIKEATTIWNEIVEEANSFPGDHILSAVEAKQMFQEQTQANCIYYNDEMAGLYILHPNNIGRCSQIANASYAITKRYRGKGLGKALVLDSIEKAKQNGFIGLQFNAVVSSNTRAIALYIQLGFTIIGTIKNGYRNKDNTYSDTIIFLKSW